MWYIIELIDNIIKLFQYAGIIIVPVILFIIFLFIKRIMLDKNQFKKIKKISIIIKCLIVFIIVSVFTVRIWGPNFYKIIISFSICHKEKVVEKRLEEKYGKNFNYISQSRIDARKYSGDTLGQDINNDYSVKYIFKDDDGVTAIVEYKKKYQSDYYESKRSKYEIEKQIYDYAKTVNFNKKFYIYVESSSESLNNSNLNDKPRDDFMLKERSHDRIIFILTEQSDENQEFIISALKSIFGEDNHYVYVHEHVVTEIEYKRAVNFYNSITNKNGIAGNDYEEYFDFNKNSQKQFKYYFIN